MIRNILVPTDFSAASRDALNCARELAAALGARLHVLHVVEQSVAPNVYTEVYVPPPSEYFENLEAAALAQLEAWVPAEDKIPFRVGLTVGLGAAADEILRRIDDDPKIDLVVMATHGRQGVAPGAGECRRASGTRGPLPGRYREGGSRFAATSSLRLCRDCTEYSRVNPQGCSDRCTAKAPKGLRRMTMTRAIRIYAPGPPSNVRSNPSGW